MFDYYYYFYYYLLSTAYNLTSGPLGAVHKVCHARGGREGVREGATDCDRGGKSMWCHTYIFFHHTFETWNLKWCLTFCCNRCILTEGGTDKNHPGQNLSDKRLPDKFPANNSESFLQGAFVRVFCTKPTKNWGGIRDVWRTFGGVPGCVTKCDRGEGGGQNWTKIAWHTFWTAPYMHNIKT